MCHLAAFAAVALCAIMAPVAQAGLLAPMTIDAGTGKDSIEVGGAIGNHRAWAGFVQQTRGVDRLYVDFAHDGTWAHPFLADSGKEVDAAGLTGSATGAAVAVFTEQVAGKDVLFARRLKNGAGGPIPQVSAPGEDAKFEPLMFHFLRGRKLVMNAAGEAAVCYHDAANAKDIIATAAPGSNRWVEHVAGNGCDDLGMDSRGDVISVGSSGGAFDATRIVGGHVTTEKIGDNIMDEDSVAVSTSGLAIFVARDTNFHIVAYRRRDITKNTPWESLGRVDSDNVFDPGDSPEEPRATLDPNGNGLIVWHSNSMNDAKTAYTDIKHGQPMTATFLAKEATDSFPYAVTIKTGMPATGFELPGTQTAVGPFHAGLPRPELTAAPGMAPTVLESAAGFVSDGLGDMLVLLFQGANPERTVAVMGDFAPPTLKPTAPRTVHARKTVTLKSGASDTFADVQAKEVTWTLPHGVKSLDGRHGLKLRVLFKHAGRYQIKLRATDRGANSATARLRVKVVL